MRWRCKFRGIEFEGDTMQTEEPVAEACDLDRLKTMQAHLTQAEHLWHEELRRRLAAYQSGLQSGIPAEEVLGHL
jgi:hypothetical protein